MVVSKMNVLKSLIDSKDGQHLTAYLTNDHNILYLRRQLREVLDEARECLARTMKPEELARFLEPIRHLSEDNKVLRNLKGNVGLFRTESSFRVLSIPVPVEQTCIMASSFHVKPLLRWIQTDREFLILGLSETTASLYVGNQNSLNHLDSIIFPEALHTRVEGGDYLGLKKRRAKKAKLTQTMKWLSDWLLNITKDTRPKLFVAGENELTRAFFGECDYPSTHAKSVWPSFTPDKIYEICAEIRTKLRGESKQHLEQLLMEFYLAEDLKLANRNIFQIAKDVMRGKVKKLIVADGINIFGKIDRKTGGLAIHPVQLDNEDDDLLDDLAQEVLARGGEVVVATRDQIPKGLPILAILNRFDSELTRGYFENVRAVEHSERRTV